MPLPIDLGALEPVWQGWVVSPLDGLLYGPAWARGLSPGDLNAWPYVMAADRALRAELARARADLAASQHTIAVLQKSVQDYRRLVLLEARYGLMLARL